jgi:hypothetical protein
LTSDFVASCSNFVARITPALKGSATMQLKFILGIQFAVEFDEFPFLFFANFYIC